MVTTQSVLKFIIGHVLAGAVVISGTLLVAFVCYIIGLTTAAGGIDTPPAEFSLFLMIMFMTAVFAVMASTASFLVSVFLTWLRTKRPFPVWAPILLVPVLTLAIILPIFRKTQGIDFVLVVTGVAFVYFGIYWTILTSSAAVLDFLRQSFFRKTSL